jgi:predicted RNA-binding protein with PUA-like domain
MAKGYWLVKQEPTAYSWDQFVRDKGTSWEGVRNYQARNNLKAMKTGDRVLYYHSVEGQAVVGIAEVAREAYQDATTKDERWVAVDLVPVAPLAKPVTLEAIKGVPALKDIPLLRQGRLSVMPLAKDAFDTIVKMGR